jgi:hypothetical protein
LFLCCEVKVGFLLLYPSILKKKKDLLGCSKLNTYFITRKENYSSYYFSSSYLILPPNLKTVSGFECLYLQCFLPLQFQNGIEEKIQITIINRQRLLFYMSTSCLSSSNDVLFRVITLGDNRCILKMILFRIIFLERHSQLTKPHMSENLYLDNYSIQLKSSA